MVGGMDTLPFPSGPLPGPLSSQGPLPEDGCGVPCGEAIAAPSVCRGSCEPERGEFKVLAGVGESRV